MKLNRRAVLLASGAALVAVTGAKATHYYLSHVRSSDIKPIIVAILDRHLGSVHIPEDSVDRFVADLALKMDRGRKRQAAWLGLLGGVYEQFGVPGLTGNFAKQFRKLEDKVITAFILGSDLLENGAAAKEAVYLARNSTCVGPSIRQFPRPSKAT